MQKKMKRAEDYDQVFDLIFRLKTQRVSELWGLNFEFTHSYLSCHILIRKMNIETVFIQP
jgi:hypothetical protein